MGKKLKIDSIDENFIINSFRQDEPVSAVAQTPTEVHKEPPTDKQPTPQIEPKDEVRRKKPKVRDDEYSELFLKEAEISARFGKTVYVRKEYHERIQRIIRVISEDEVSLFSYIDNVLAHHFASFQEDIMELYDKKNKSIF